MESKQSEDAGGGQNPSPADDKKAGDWLLGACRGEETVYVHGGTEPDPLTGAILPPIYQSTTFVQESVENYMHKGFSYSRTANPTVLCLERKIAELESGFGACCFATGMAATVTVFSAFLSPGDHCLVTNCSYGGTNRCARLHFSKYNIDFEFIDFRDLSNIDRAIRPATKLVFSESPCNPTLYLADVEAISKICKARKILHVCDSTFATPYMMRPLELGADIVVQSTSKYYDGHNCTLGGAVISSSKDIHEKIFFLRNVLGNTMSAQTAFYTLLTVKTLAVRVEKQSANAQRIAEFLSKHPKVERVIYPGLPSFPQRELALKQHKHDVHGGMLAFEVKGGADAGIRLMNHAPRPWSLCENLGACESIITCPAVFTHANMLREDRLKVGITDGFIRVSVGIEDVRDLIQGLDYALTKV